MPRFCCRRAMALQLPPEVWECVSDFLPSAPLPRLCHKTWRALGMRHVTLWVNAENVDAKLRRVAAYTALRTLTLRSYRLGPPGAQALAVLPTATGLTAIDLLLSRSNVSDGGAEALGGLRTAPFLTSVAVDLAQNQVTDAGARALAALKAAPALRHLALQLHQHCIGDEGAVALAELRSAPALRSLTLQLSGNRIGDGGARALAGLREAPALQRLRLHLNGNHVRCGGAEALATLGTGRSLTSLGLDLYVDQGGDPAACALASALKGATCLTSLSLHLTRNEVPPPPFPLPPMVLFVYRVPSAAAGVVGWTCQTRPLRGCAASRPEGVASQGGPYVPCWHGGENYARA